MGCSCKHLGKEIAEVRREIHKLRLLFINRMTVDSETTDRRKKDFNQAIFTVIDNGTSFQNFNYIDMDMILNCFDKAVKDWRRTFCDVDNCNRY